MATLSKLQAHYNRNLPDERPAKRSRPSPYEVMSISCQHTRTRDLFVPPHSPFKLSYTSENVCSTSSSICTGTPVILYYISAFNIPTSVCSLRLLLSAMPCGLSSKLLTLAFRKLPSIDGAVLEQRQAHKCGLLRGRASVQRYTTVGYASRCVCKQIYASGPVDDHR